VLWKDRGFLTSSARKVSNREAACHLLPSVQLPEEIATIHCPNHTKHTTEISKGNALAAKAAAQQPLEERTVTVLMIKQSEWPDLTTLKSCARKTVQQRKRKNRKSGKENRMIMGYGQLGENLYCPRNT